MYRRAYRGGSGDYSSASSSGHQGRIRTRSGFQQRTEQLGSKRDVLHDLPAQGELLVFSAPNQDDVHLLLFDELPVLFGEASPDSAHFAGVVLVDAVHVAAGLAEDLLLEDGALLVDELQHLWPGRFVGDVEGVVEVALLEGEAGRGDHVVAVLAVHGLHVGVAEDQ